VSQEPRIGESLCRKIFVEVLLNEEIPILFENFRVHELRDPCRRMCLSRNVLRQGLQCLRIIDPEYLCFLDADFV